MKKQSKSPLIYIGNKTELVDAMAHAMPSGAEKRRWVVPFFGSGSSIFHFRPKRALVTDFTPELIHFWQQVQKNPHQVWEAAIEALGDAMSPDNRILVGGKTTNPALKARFYEVRSQINEMVLSGEFGPYRAGLYLFINRFGYRGRWRVNAKGTCNIPFDHNRARGGSLPKKKLFFECADYLRTADVEIRNERWEKTLRSIDELEDTFVLADPPYDGVSYDYSDTVAGSPPFGRRDQLRLCGRALKIVRAGGMAMLHNNPTEFIQHLYGRHRDLRWLWIDRDHKVGYGKKIDASATEVIITGG